MKRIIPVLILSTVFFINFKTFTQDIIKDISENYKLIWEFKNIGEIKDISNISETNDVLFLAKNDKSFHLYLLDEAGKLKWHKTKSLDNKWIKLHGLSVSNNGETIIVKALDSKNESLLNWIYDINGNLLFYNNSDAWYFTSPSGKYITIQYTNRFYPLSIYTNDGSLLEMQIPDELQTERQMHRFITENEVLIYRETIDDQSMNPELILITIPDIKVKWTKKLEKKLWLIDFNERNCATSKNHIALQGTSRPGNILLFSKSTGELIWEVNDPETNHGLAFSQSGDYLFSLSGGKYLYIIEVSNGNIVAKDQLFSWGGIYDIPKFSFFDNWIIIFSNLVNAKDAKLFGTDRHINDPYSVIIKVSDELQISDKIFSPAIMQFYTSKNSFNKYLFGTLKAEKNNIVKYQLREGTTNE
jgi:hypothetical protein